MKTSVSQLQARMFETRAAGTPLPRVQVGSFVKIGLRGERFWCRVVGVGLDDLLRVTVDNDLLKSPLSCGDEIKIQREHVLEAADISDRLTFQAIATALGSHREAALVWRDLRRLGGSTVQPQRRAHFVFQ